MIFWSKNTRGFTLLEILLVVMVIGIAAAAFLPFAVNSVEAARTRSALREVISINRYARSRAILDKRPTSVVYNTEQNTLTLLSLPVRREPESETFFGAVVDSEATASPESTEVIRSKSLPKFVQVRNVEGAEKEQDGYFVIYMENGSTDTHSVELQDPQGTIERIQINGLTGEISLEN
jgi:prepilin-type N-terminal cleavage/methylation domain-containing protein